MRWIVIIFVEVVKGLLVVSTLQIEWVVTIWKSMCGHGAFPLESRKVIEWSGQKGH